MIRQPTTELAKQARVVWRTVAQARANHAIPPESQSIIVSSDCIITREVCEYPTAHGEMEQAEFARRFEIDKECEREHEPTADIIADMLHYGREVMRVEFVSWQQALKILLADEQGLLAALERRVF